MRSPTLNRQSLPSDALTSAVGASAQVDLRSGVLPATLGEHIVDSAQEGVVVYDRDGRIRVWNPYMERLTGLDRSQCLGKVPHEVFPFLVDAGVPNGIVRALAGESVEIAPFPWGVAETGRSGWARSVQAPLCGIDGEILGVIETVTDITDIMSMRDELLRSNVLLHAVVQASTDWIFAKDCELTKILDNGVLCNLLGRVPIELQDPRAVAIDLEVLQGRSSRLEESFLKANGEAIVIELIRVPLRNAEGEITGLVGFGRDVTERKKAQGALELSATVYRAVGEAIMIARAGDPPIIMAVNPVFCRVTGYSEEEAVGQTTRLLNSGRHPAWFYADLWSSLASTGHWQGEIWNRRKSGEDYLEWLAISTVYGDDGQPAQYVAMFSEITEHKKAVQTIWYQANFDPVTGVPNRRLLRDRIDRAMKRASRGGFSVALLLLDLDHFKEINDVLGHERGDALLKSLSMRLCGAVREIDTVARLGGDEFCIVLGDLEDLSVVDRVSRNVLEKVAEPVHVDTELVSVSTSMGITVYPHDGTTVDELLKNADQAMYASKREGRNRARYFTRSMNEASQARARLVSDLRMALADDQFTLHYQPIIELGTGGTTKAEALIRWNHPTRGLIAPAEFIPLAEETGLISEIGDWVFREAARCLSFLKAGYPSLQLSINVSPIQLCRRDSRCRHWGAHLDSLPLSGESLIIEITEGLLLDASVDVAENLRFLAQAGMSLAIDDFGTGYSSLAYLRKFDVDVLKIDKSFTQNISPDSDSLILCEAIIGMAHKLGLKVIAEGVETQEQGSLLDHAGCDHAQGFYFARPMPQADFERWLSGTH